MKALSDIQIAFPERRGPRRSFEVRHAMGHRGSDIATTDPKRCVQVPRAVRSHLG
jgi:hypothetical protein